MENRSIIKFIRRQFANDDPQMMNGELDLVSGDFPNCLKRVVGKKSLLNRRLIL